ncbi:hypothetical protein NliqN6_3793 [Naganishia liquefaciens]|uniref:mitogen-activated protein kinase kinase n=1 Tax=Naganishia liquefaciens TaxID=104408 RepID=A0A8H3TTS6_9TREE|nr:hypothetical protein NliqN6_3793 [Naganishia liquefaciens]
MSAPTTEASASTEVSVPDEVQKGMDQLKITNADDAAPSPGPATISTPAGSTPEVRARDMAASSSNGAPAPTGTRTFGANRLPPMSGQQSPNGARPMAPAPRIGMPSSSTAPGSSNGVRPGQPPNRMQPPSLMGMRGRGVMSPGQGTGQTKLPPSLQAKMDAQMARVAKEGASANTDRNDPTSMSSLLASAAARASAPAPSSPNPRPGGPALGGLAARRAAAAASAGGAGGPPSLAGRGPGPGMGISGGMGGGPGAGGPGMAGRLRRPGQGLTLSSMGGGAGPGRGASDAPFSSFRGIVDPSGRLNFQSKAVLHADGVDFTNGQSYKINKDEMELQEELGKGNYGSVQKVYHRPTKVVMAMKEIRLELDESKLNGIIMELDILHRAVAPEIIEFYGAFTIESCVYYCMEYMDAGSLDRMHGDGVPEDVLARITKSIIKGLRFLKDELSVMHRDVKPTNVLVNTKGQVKLCDFGVSGQLEKSLAKTNIGCQSYMAPERIKGESQNNLGTYTVSSDVWSVGLSIIELAMGCYPYPPETYSNVFAQLQAIVHGPPPRLPEGYSDVAQDFVAQCLQKEPEKRWTYAQLLDHPWMKADAEREVDMVGWVARALEARAAKKKNGAAVSSSGPEVAINHADGPATTTAGDVVPNPNQQTTSAEPAQQS